MISVWATAALLCAAQDQGDTRKQFDELRQRHEQALRDLEQQRRKIDEEFRRRSDELGGTRREGDAPRPRPEGEGRPRPPQERPEGERPPRPEGEGRRPQPPPRCACEMKCLQCHPQRPPQENPAPRERR